MQNDPNQSAAMKSNPALRYQAIAALKGNWQIALVVSFIAMLPGLAAAVVRTLNAGSLLGVLGNVTTQVYAAAIQGREADALGIFTRLYAMIPQATKTLNSALQLAAFLVTPMLTMGSMCFYQRLIRRDGAPEIKTVFSRARLFFKAMGLQLWLALKVFLWALPGLAVLGASLAVSYFATSFTQQGFSWLVTMTIVGYVGTLTLMALAALRYSQAMPFMADHPEAGVGSCVQASKKVMAGRKGRLVGMYCSFLIWGIVLTLVQELCYAMAGNILSVTVSLLGQLLLNVYMTCCLMSFYDAWKADGVTELRLAPQSAAPADGEDAAYDDFHHD